MTKFLLNEAVREHLINKVPMTSIKLPESRNNFREVTERFTSRKLFLLSGSSIPEVGIFKFVCSLKEMPNEFSIDDLIEKLILIQSFEEGRQQYQAGRVFTHQEIGQKLEKWLK